MGLTGFITIINFFNYFIEGNTLIISNHININTWFLMLHNGVTVP